MAINLLITLKIVRDIINMFRVISYNCNKGLCSGSIGNIITEANADIICLQEFNQVVAEHLIPYNLQDSYIFITSPLTQGWSSNVIYSRFPIIKSSILQLSGKSRQTQIVTVSTPNAHITIACIHLDAGRDNIETRAVQYMTLLDQLSDAHIIIGDYNMVSNEVPWPPIGWNGTELVPTFVSINPCVKSSAIFAYPFDRCLYQGLVLKEFGIIGAVKPASDHYGIALTFTIPGQIMGPNYIVRMDAKLMQDLSERMIGSVILGIDDTWLDNPMVVI